MNKKSFTKSYTSLMVCKVFTFINTDNIRLSEEQKDRMEGEITIKEATTALKNMKKNVSPGLDGLTTEFYICFWSRLKETIVKAYNESYREGKLYSSALKGVVKFNSEEKSRY